MSETRRRGIGSRRGLGDGVPLAKWLIGSIALVVALAVLWAKAAIALTFSPSAQLEQPLEALVPPCKASATVIGELAREGLPLTNAFTRIDGSAIKIALQMPSFLADPSDPRCNLQYVAPPASSTTWALAARPTNSAAALQDVDTLTPRLRPDRAGEYVIRLTACQNDACKFVLSPSQSFTVPAFSRELVFTAVEQLTPPPQTQPFVGTLPATNRTHFEDIEDRCGFAPEFLSAAWRMAREWRGPDDYDLLEGEVTGSHVASSDYFANHSSMDWIFFVEPDPPYQYLLPTGAPLQAEMEVEWERKRFPNNFRPTRGDRVSTLGYWIHDCGHNAKTEIHPPVMSVAHRARPILLPETAGVGRNVYIAGIVSDVWISALGGETTEQCGGFGLAQLRTAKVPVGSNGVPISCLPKGEGFDSNPINRSFSFRVHLPKNPKLVLEELGRTGPDLEVFFQTLDPAGDAGPSPAVTLVPHEDGNAHLEVTIDLSGFSGQEYTHQIVAGWVYPSPDNWGIHQWQLLLWSLNAHTDLDGWDSGDGDWRFWVNTNNRYQEWTTIFDCDGCVHGLETFGDVPWKTGPGFFSHSLGPHLRLFPGQEILFQTRGFESDTFFSNGVGSVSKVHPQQPGRFTETAPTNVYTLDYEIVDAGPVPTPQLTAEGQAIYDAYTLSSGGPMIVVPDGLYARRNLRVPELAPLPDTKTPVPLADLKLFHRHDPEPSSFQHMSTEDFKRHVAAARKAQPKELAAMMKVMKSKLVRSQKYADPKDVQAVLATLEGAVPADLFATYLSSLKAAPPPTEPRAVPWGWLVLCALSSALLGYWLSYARHRRTLAESSH